jgi:hypothetical protein
MPLVKDLIRSIETGEIHMQKQKTSFRLVGVGIVSVPFVLRADGTMDHVIVDLSNEGAKYYDYDAGNRIDIIRGVRVEVRDRCLAMGRKPKACTISVWYRGREVSCFAL